MSIRDNLDISAYLVLGPENTLGRPVGDVVAQALDAGFTCIQVRSKVASAREIIALTGDAAQQRCKGCSLQERCQPQATTTLLAAARRSLFDPEA